MQERKTLGQKLDKLLSNISIGFDNFCKNLIKTTMGENTKEYMGDDKLKVTPEMIRVRISAVISLISGLAMACFAYGYVRAKVIIYIMSHSQILENGVIEPPPIEPPPGLWGWFYTILWGFFMLFASICILSGICIILRITLLHNIKKRDEIATTDAAIMILAYVVMGLLIYIFKIPVWVNI